MFILQNFHGMLIVQLTKMGEIGKIVEFDKSKFSDGIKSLKWYIILFKV